MCVCVCRSCVCMCVEAVCVCAHVYRNRVCVHGVCVEAVCATAVRTGVPAGGGAMLPEQQAETAAGGQDGNGSAEYKESPRQMEET